MMVEKLPEGPPMDLANMRQNGVRSLEITCLDCKHETVRNMDDFDPGRAVKSFEGRFACSACGSRRNQVRPNWGERPAPMPWAGYDK